MLIAAWLLIDNLTLVEFLEFHQKKKRLLMWKARQARPLSVKKAARREAALAMEAEIREINDPHYQTNCIASWVDDRVTWHVPPPQPRGAFIESISVLYLLILFV
jgi:hypothetical protein